MNCMVGAFLDMDKEYKRCSEKGECDDYNPPRKCVYTQMCVPRVHECVSPVFDLNSYGLCRYGLCGFGLYSYGLYSFGLYSFGLCSNGLYIYGLYNCGLYSYGQSIQMCNGHLVWHLLDTIRTPLSRPIDRPRQADRRRLQSVFFFRCRLSSRRAG